MKKIEALNYIKLHKGYIPYIGIFDIYNDEDVIPQELINLSIEDGELRGNFMICSAHLAKELKKLN